MAAEEGRTPVNVPGGAGAQFVADPKDDFAAWSEWMEAQALANLRLQDVPMGEWGAEVDRALGECYDEIDAMAEKLGRPVAPVGPGDWFDEEVAERMVAVGLAVKTFVPPSLIDTSLDEVFALLEEHIEAVVRGDVWPDGAAQAEVDEREKVARLIERRSRGDTSYLHLAKQLRQRRSGRVVCQHRVLRLPRQPSLKRQPRSHRGRSRGRPSRGDPARDDDSGASQVPSPGSTARPGTPRPETPAAAALALERGVSLDRMALEPTERDFLIVGASSFADPERVDAALRLSYTPSLDVPEKLGRNKRIGLIFLAVTETKDPVHTELAKRPGRPKKVAEAWIPWESGWGIALGVALPRNIRRALRRGPDVLDRSPLVLDETILEIADQGNGTAACTALLYELLSNLSPTELRLFELRRLPAAIVAALLGISLAAVRKRRSRLDTKLAEAWNGNPLHPVYGWFERVQGWNPADGPPTYSKPYGSWPQERQALTGVSAAYHDSLQLRLPSGKLSNPNLPQKELRALRGEVNQGRTLAPAEWNNSESFDDKAEGLDEVTSP
jgi:hypothetical protein